MCLKFIYGSGSNCWPIIISHVNAQSCLHVFNQLHQTILEGEFNYLLLVDLETIIYGFS